MRVIMITASKIKWVRSLARKKFRKESGLFIAEGDKIVRELASSNNLEIQEVFALENWTGRKQLPESIPFTVVNVRELERISLLSTPNQALALVKIPEYDLSTIPIQENHILVLDNIQDPGNLGTIIRTADWFGIRDIVCSHATAELYNPKVIQATMGSFARVRVHYTNLESFLGSLAGDTPVLGAMLSGEMLHTARLPQKAVLVMGNESQGISQQVVPYLTQKIFIPRGQSGASGAESLNAAVATGIILSALCSNQEFR